VPKIIPLPDKARPPHRVAAEQPAYWFCVMEAAKECGDFELAARAKRELERLGVLVTFRPGRRRPRGGGDHAA
jgi:hypothetical protein